MKKSAVKYWYLFVLIFTFSFLIFNSSFSQVPTVQDCMGAIPVCQDVYVELNSYSGDGNYPNEIYNPTGNCQSDCPGSCLDGEQNSVWYIFTVQVSGNLRLTIDPMGNDDYDWAVYDLTDLRCADIYSRYSEMQMSCNAYGSPPDGNTGISSAHGGTSNCNACGATNIWNIDLPVFEGRTYVLVVENWSGTNQGFTLDFSSSTASIYDNVRPELQAVLADEIACGTNEIVVDFSENVMCKSVGPSDFIFEGTGGPYTVLDAQGEACLVGGEMEKRYTLILDKPVKSNGDYSVKLVPENDIYDGCNNIAIGDTIAFTLDLGAAFVNDSGIIITGADYGQENGSITGLVVEGNEPLSYRWYDHYNDTVGTELELHNVGYGNYYLEVTDSSGCETNTGPYYVELIEGIPGEGQNVPGGISVFRNPNPGKFTIRISGDVTNVSILNVLGNKLCSFDREEISSKTLQLDLSRNGAGIYLVKATLDNGRVVTRIVQIL